MTINPDDLNESITYLTDMAECMEDEGLDRENNARHYRMVCQAAQAHAATLKNAPVTNASEDVREAVAYFRKWIISNSGNYGPIFFIKLEILMNAALKQPESEDVK